MSFVSIVCCRCKETFGLDAETHQGLRRSSVSFHCPWGHPQHFPQGPSEADTLRLERDRLAQKIAEEQDRTRQERTWRREADARTELERRRAAAARGQVTRLKNRAAAGLCPCCNRSFVNLQRHMASKHAGFTVEEVQANAGVTIQ